MRCDRERLLDIQDAIAQIRKYADRVREGIEQDELVQVWVLHHLRIIGEAARALSQDFKQQHPDVPWKDIVGMRHVLVHDYFEIDVDVVAKVVEDDLPRLKQQVAGILEEMPDET